MGHPAAGLLNAPQILIGKCLFTGLCRWNAMVMRDLTKVVIGFGSIWGLFVLGGALFGSFTIGSNDTIPEIVAWSLNGLSILPCCILAIWVQRTAAWWLVIVSVVSVFGFAYQIFTKDLHKPPGALFGETIWTLLFLAGIPALLGVLLLRSSPREKPIA